MPLKERRPSLVERRSLMHNPNPAIPHLTGLEKPQETALLKIDECDVLIQGTGLTESILAAALAWNGTQVVHIDAKDGYGDATATLTIEQLKKWVLEVNAGKVGHFHLAQIYIPGGKTTNRFVSRDYGIDLCPKVMFCKLDFVLLLLKLRVHKYCDLRPLLTFHTYENDDFSKLLNQLTKKNIFMDKLLSLATKRYLMKFLKFVLSDDDDKRAVVKEHGGVPIDQFLAQQFNLNEPQVDELIYTLGLCNGTDTPAAEALKRIKRFLTSFDQYGNFPVMVLRYGGPGEVSQGFCRNAAVAGTVYKLHTALTDYDPALKEANFSDGLRIKIKDKVVISPTQVPKFLADTYAKAIADLPRFNVTRLITVVRQDCKEWMSQGTEALTILVFPPKLLPLGNRCSVQVIIQNGDLGVCPTGQAIWYAQTVEQDLNQAKADLDCANTLMEKALLRELADDSELEDVFEGQEVVYDNRGTPIIANSFKLGALLQLFVPKKKLDVVCKVGYVQETLINPDLTTTFRALKPHGPTNIVLQTVPDAADIIFMNAPLLEISYDGVVTEAKLAYARITGSDEDFFDVDFEDDDDDEAGGAAVAAAAAVRSGNHLRIPGNPLTTSQSNTSNEMAFEDSSDDEAHHPFRADEMEL